MQWGMQLFAIFLTISVLLSHSSMVTPISLYISTQQSISLAEFDPISQAKFSVSFLLLLYDLFLSWGRMIVAVPYSLSLLVVR